MPYDPFSSIPPVLSLRKRLKYERELVRKLEILLEVAERIEAKEQHDSDIATVATCSDEEGRHA